MTQMPIETIASIHIEIAHARHQRVNSPYRRYPTIAGVSRRISRRRPQVELEDGRPVQVEALSLDGAADGDSIVLDLDDLAASPLPARTS